MFLKFYLNNKIDSTVYIVVLFCQFFIVLFQLQHYYMFQKVRTCIYLKVAGAHIYNSFLVHATIKKVKEKVGLKSTQYH